MMLAVAAVAVVLASVLVYIPWLLWRTRVDRIIDRKLVESEPVGILFYSPTFQQMHGLTASELQDLLDAPDYVTDRLLAISRDDPSWTRRSRVLSDSLMFLTENGREPLLRKSRDRVLRRAIAGTGPDSDESAAVDFVTSLGSFLGFDDAQRTAILARARRLARGPDPSHLLRHWVLLIGAIGGEREIEFLLELEDTLPEDAFVYPGHFPLEHSRSPALLARIRRWLDDPSARYPSATIRWSPGSGPEQGRGSRSPNALSTTRSSPARPRAGRCCSTSSSSPPATSKSAARP